MAMPRRLGQRAEHLEVGRLKLLAAHLFSHRDEGRQPPLHDDRTDGGQASREEAPDVFRDRRVPLQRGKPDRALVFSLRRPQRPDQVAVVRQSDSADLLRLQPLECRDVETGRILSIVGQEQAGRIDAELPHDTQDQRVEERLELERGV